MGKGVIYPTPKPANAADFPRPKANTIPLGPEPGKLWGDAPPPIPESNTPWEELFREKTGQMSEGAVLEFAVKYRGTSRTTPRHNH